MVTQQRVTMPSGLVTVTDALLGFPGERESTGIGHNDAKERAMRVSVFPPPESPAIVTAVSTSDHTTTLRMGSHFGGNRLPIWYIAEWCERRLKGKAATQ